jgi:hypothetical protein
MAGEFHRFRAADLDELRLELLHCAALEMRSDRGLIAVTLHQSPLLAVSAQIKLIVQRSRFLLIDANHLFRDCLKFPELTVMDFQINQQTNASGCQAFLLGSIEIAPFLPNFCLAEERFTGARRPPVLRALGWLSGAGTILPKRTALAPG